MCHEAFSADFAAAFTVRVEGLMDSAAVRGAELEHRSRIQEDAWISDVIRREQGRLRAYVRSKLRATSDIEDVLQDVFVNSY
jgi:hypothetical protein